MSEFENYPRKRIEIQTSCGATFSPFVDDLSDEQLSGLIEQNQDSAETQILRDEVTRRHLSRQERAA